MNPLVFHLVSGDAFFSGVGCFLLAAWLGQRETMGARRVASLLALVGGVLVFFATIALSMWVYLILIVVSVGWLIAIRRKQTTRRTVSNWSIGLAACWLGVGVLLFNRVLPVGPVELSVPTIIVVGDSVSAGIREDETTWPKLVREQGRFKVVDLSRAGAKVADALEIVRTETLPEGAVIVEIGGNDLFGGTSDAEFERDLDALLKEVTQEGRPVLMWELPLPPLKSSLGESQRRLSRKYDVALIPRRDFLSILATENATLDSIHLSPTGHRAMADYVTALFRVASP